MNLLMFFRQGFSSIWANKLRSILSILGIVIGISSVVIMLAFGEGAKASILDTFQGSNNLVTIEKKYVVGDEHETEVVPGKGAVLKGSYMKTTTKEVITMEVADKIKEEVFGIKNVSYGLSTNAGSTYNSKQLHGQVIGISPSYFLSKSYKIKFGTYFSNKNYENNDKVLIVGDSIAKDTFGGKNPIGENIFLNGVPFVIVGVIDKGDYMSDSSIFIPSTTAINRLGAKELQKIEVLGKDGVDVNAIKRDLQYYLFKLSGAYSPSKISFEVKTNEDILKQANQIIAQMKLLLGAIGSISLIVGGIGIMNIMLVSVTERTREIGIRKSIGATKSDILFQFLTESVILSIIGFIIAIIFCFMVTYVIAKLAPNFKAVITESVFILASSVSIGMGIIFGLMPAYKAARLKPIDALRWE